MKTYALDTSALMAFYQDEAGAKIIETLLKSAKKQQIKVLVSFMACMEFFYKAWQGEGKAAAYRAYIELSMLPIERIEVSEDILVQAVELKANYQLSLGDSWIAAAAYEHDAILVHKDPEFDVLKNSLSLQALPYKKKS